MPYIKVPLNRVISVEKIVSVYSLSLDKNYVYAGESHDFWELIFVRGGRVNVSSGGGVYGMCEGEILFHRPDAFHSVHCDGVNSAKVIIISFDSHSAAMDLLGECKMSVSDRSERYIDSILYDASECFEIGTSPLVQRKDAPIGAEQILRCTLESFLISLLQMREEDEHGGRLFFTSRDELECCLADDIMLYLREHVRERVTLDELCAHFHFGKSHICHIFKSKVGKSIVRCFIDMKLELAKEMLSCGKYNVSEVAAALSFESSQYFSKLFRRTVGVPPSYLIPR